MMTCTKKNACQKKKKNYESQFRDNLMMNDKIEKKKQFKST